MNNRYKVTISNNNLYKEIELDQDCQQLKVGTGIDCDVRLRKELFFGPVELLFVRNGEAWSILCSDNIYLTAGDVRKLLTKNLVHGDLLEIKYQESDQYVFSLEFYIDFDDGKTKYERAVNIKNRASLTIGSKQDDNIVLKSDYVKCDEVLLNKKNTNYELSIRQTTYGVYVNGKRAKNGDSVSSGDFLSISDFFFYIKDDELWTQIRKGLTVNGLEYIDRPTPNTYPEFRRNTRVKTVVCDEKIEILDPPAKPQKPKNNLFMRLLPSMGMLLAAGVMAFFGGMMIIMSAISGGMAIFTTIMSIREANKDYKENSADRIEKYNAYAAKKRAEIQKLRDEERDSLEDIYISQETAEHRLETFSSSLFDRTPEDEDFLCVRLGSGDVSSLRVVDYKKQERLEIEDELQNIPQEIYEEFKNVHQAPIVCDLKSVNAIGITGKPEYRFEFLKNIVIDITARQYFSDVNLVFVADHQHEEDIRWLRFLPHIYNENLKIRNMVCDDESKNVVFEYLYKELSIREQNKRYDCNIVVFFYNEYGFKSHPISKFVNKAKDLGVSFLFFGNTAADIPQGSGYLVTIEDQEHAVLTNTQNKSETSRFEYHTIPTQRAEKIVKLLAPVYTEEISLEGALTKNISMFEMLNILAVDDIDLKSRWSKSQVFKSMAAPIGVSKTGIVYLDLHDKAHGPHGLVAGTTGSGKSEILQTYILAMSTLFHPYEVAFVIIDFKGGGMVNQFRELPHLLGAITNIDGKEINRSLKSIKAELQKRQRLFAEADVNHIDKYIKKFKSGEVSTPLPHLIIIVDEFAELKAEQPEFMKELISAARIGRSLGVHLILATQKPSGQVNEQIWSNSRFKLCLKVQSQEDSNEVIKSPLAAEIKEPGRAYLQVGNNEIFELFQSAYSGASEKVDDSNVKEFTLYRLNLCGKRTPIYSQKRKKSEGANTTQLDAIVDYISQFCLSNGISRLPNICLPPLVDYLTIPDQLIDYTIDALPLGIYDDPDSQYQGYARFNICDENTVIIGSSQTGKTNLLQSIIRLVASKYSPRQAIFYIADFGAMYLKNFESLNHVGGVVTISESEKFKNLFKLLGEEVQRRKSRFMDCGLSSYAAYCDAGYNDLPRIFFMVDNFSAFKEVYSDAFEDQFVFLAREGIACGISVVVTNATTNGLGYRYMSNFACRLAFKCNDSGEYMNIFDRCRIQPKDVPGRALCKINKELYEMQSFIAFEGEKEFERSNAITAFVEITNKQYPAHHAKCIPCVPELLTFSYLDQCLKGTTTRQQYPIALDYANVDVVMLDFKAMNEFCVFGRDSAKKLSVTNSILAAIHHNVLQKPLKLYIIDSVERQLKSKQELGYVEKYTIDYSEIGNIFDEIMPEIESRYNMQMDGDFDKLSKCPQIIILINNKDTVEYISATKNLLEVYNRITKQFKSLGIAFMFSDIDDVTVSYSGPELLKKFKEAKKGIITSNLQEFKFCDLPSGAMRNNRTVNAGDVFLLDGSDVTRIKLAEEVQK